MDTAILQEFKTALEKERERLIAELKAIARPDLRMKGDWDAKFPQFEVAQAGEYGSHTSLEEEADEVEEYEVRLESEHSLESRLLAVNHALARIQDGTYGVCGRCGKEVPLERLRANSAAEACAEHAT